MERKAPTGSLNEEYQLGDTTVCKWKRAFLKECETDPD